MKQWIFFFDSIALSFSMLFKNKSLYYVNFFVKNYSDTFFIGLIFKSVFIK